MGGVVGPAEIVDPYGEGAVGLVVAWARSMRSDGGYTAGLHETAAFVCGFEHSQM